MRLFCQLWLIWSLNHWFPANGSKFKYDTFVLRVIFKTKAWNECTLMSVRACSERGAHTHLYSFLFSERTALAQTHSDSVSKHYFWRKNQNSTWRWCKSSAKRKDDTFIIYLGPTLQLGSLSILYTCYTVMISNVCS